MSASQTGLDNGFLEINHRHFNIHILYQQYGLAMSKF